VKVFPHEYKRVLGVNRSEEQYRVPLLVMQGGGATEVAHG